MTPSAPLLRFRALRKTIGAGRILLDIDEFAIAAGRCTMLTGPNGAGKTTLLKILAGLEPPDRAFVDYDGASLPWSAARRRYRREVIYLHQQAYLFDCSVAGNVAYGLHGLGLARAEVARRVAQALDWAGLAHLAPRNARALSGGEKQRVALTRALVLAPRVLLLDEPFTGLDEEARERAGFLIERLKADRVGVAVTSHELPPLARIVDLHLELRDGRLAPPARTQRAANKTHRPADAAPRGRVVYLNTGAQDEAG